MKSSARKMPAKPPHSRRNREFREEKNLRLFCDMTAQELSTTLAAIVGELDYALSINQNTPRERSMMVAVSAAERALGLARNLRYFSLHARFDFTIVDLSQVLLDSVELVEKEFDLAGVQLSVLAEAATCLRADAAALQQLILNMLDHSRHRLLRGGKVTLSLRRIDRTLQILCTESGPAHPNNKGVSEEQAPTEVLALSVCRTLAEAHNGNLSRESHPDETAVTRVTFPAEPTLRKPEGFAEERRFRRIELDLPAEVTFQTGQQTFKARLTILSVGGCYAQFDEPGSRLPELHEPVSVTITHFEGEKLSIPRGRVANIHWAGAQSGVGIEFLEVDNRNQKLINALVKSHSL